MWDENKFIEDKITKLSEPEAWHALNDAWLKVFKECPKIEILCCLMSQTALETGRYSFMHCYNWGNIKSKPNDGKYWTMFSCSEIINGKEIFFKPPHDQTKFRAYYSASEGAEDYILFLKKNRYKEALKQLKYGSVKNYTIALKNASYFTASLNLYLKGMERLYNEFHKKSDKLLSWKPEFPTPIPETKLEDIFTAEEKSQILQSVNKSVDEFIQNWFDSNRNSIDDDFDYVKIEKKSWWQSIKSRLKL